MEDVNPYTPKKQMNVLAVETSMTVCSVAILEGSKLVCDFSANNKLTHSERLMPWIDRAFVEWGGRPSDIDVFAVSAGPGSFTGLRIGAATVMGLCMGADKPIVGISTLEALCYNLPYYDGPIIPMTDARRGNVFTAVYSISGKGSIEVLEPPCVREVSRLVEQYGGKGLFIGEGAIVYASMLSDASVAPPNLCIPRAASLGVAALGKNPVPIEQFKLDYVREWKRG